MDLKQHLVSMREHCKYNILNSLCSSACKYAELCMMLSTEPCYFDNRKIDKICKVFKNLFEPVFEQKLQQDKKKAALSSFQHRQNCDLDP